MSHSIKYYFVDEAGDANLFSRKGKVLIGTPGCSRFFLLGLLDVGDPVSLNGDLETLRARLLADPYFASVPSMKPEADKTARAFHATDDLPEVRREVFSLLRGRQDLRFLAVIRDKESLLRYVRQQQHRDRSYRYQPNELYDYLVRRLFKEQLHKSDQYMIHFATRGASDRTAALETALHTARDRFCQKHNIQKRSEIKVIPTASSKSAALQAVDYFLWALQRLYEQKDDRYVLYLWPAFRLVMDVDDIQNAGYGVYYTQKNPLTREALEKRNARI